MLGIFGILLGVLGLWCVNHPEKIRSKGRHFLDQMSRFIRLQVLSYFFLKIKYLDTFQGSGDVRNTFCGMALRLCVPWA